MPWGRIFISHSTKTEEARDFLNAVKRALKKGFDVLVDEMELQAGDDWREKIYEWIEEAHGAILLLTPEALKSKFVQIEASVLSWRSYRQPNFVFIPILVGGLKRAHLKKGVYGKLAVDSVHVVDLGDPDAMAKKVVKVFRERLRDLSGPRTAFEVLVDLVAERLRTGGVSVRGLYEVGSAKLSWARSLPRASGDALYEKFARDLLAAEPLQALEAVELLVDRGQKGARELLDLVAPFWVRAEDAKPIAELAMLEGSKRAIALHGERWAQDSYISRSCLRSLTQKHDVCELTRPTKRDTFTEYSRQIIARFLSEEDRYAEKGDRERAKEYIEDRAKRKPLFVVFPPELVPDTNILKQLQREFKNLTFFVVSGPADQAKLRPLRDKLDFLKPPDPELERRTRLRYMEIKARLDGATPA